ncbi:MAG: type II toxin-antitoxin system RelE/ParE family toxin [Azospira sp.]|nr:type II toxin-antitoxin system RelE/ParE family toxin [Azospira sp.]
MSRIELAPEVRDDFDRILDHLGQHQVENPAARIHEIVAAIGVLETNPLIGRPAESGKRELVIGRRSHGYVALYRYVAEIDTVFVLAIRAQREAGFGRE